MLGFAWAGYMFCVGRIRFAVLRALMPGIVLLLVSGVSPSTNVVSPVVPLNSPFSYWAELKFAIGYEWRLRMAQRGLSMVIPYTWLWAALWPAFLLAVPAAVRSLRRRDADAFACAIMMVCSPLL